MIIQIDSADAETENYGFPGENATQSMVVHLPKWQMVNHVIGRFADKNS